MNRIDNKFLLTRDNFIPKLLLKHPGFTYSAFGPFTKHPERIKNIKVTGNLNYIDKKELDKVCFIYNAAYSYRKDVAKRTISDKILKDRPFKNGINPKYNGHQRGLASMVYKLLYKENRIRSKCT